MRAVVQRVTRGSVAVEGDLVGKIETGLVVLLGVGKNDTAQDAAYLAEKIAHLRIFEDAEGKMNLSAVDIGAGVLVVSQFTLYGDCRKGRRPAFTEAAGPETAEALYEELVKQLRQLGLHVETGRFQTMMLVEIHNDGPVTLLLDSKKIF
ncbi:MAG: D-aminoacyl-tRNA deacylase [Bacillota bacterium]